jgi:carbon monoxide dehydrogenase subunit G
MKPISIENTVRASKETTWAELRVLERHVNWMADAASLTFHSDQREGVGTTFTCLTKVGPIRLRDVMTITEWVNGSHMSVRHQGLVTGEGTFRLTESGNGTTVTWTERLRFPLWLGGPLGELVARPIFLLIWRGNLRRLAQIVEN